MKYNLLSIRLTIYSKLMLTKTITVLLVIYALAVAQYDMVVLLRDGTQSVLKVSENGRVQVDSQSLRWDQKSIPVSQVRKITFSMVTAIEKNAKEGLPSAPTIDNSFDIQDKIAAEIITLDGRVLKVLYNQIVVSGELCFEKKHILGGLPAGLYFVKYRIPSRECQLQPVIWRGK